MLQIGGQNKFHPPTAQDTTWYSGHADIQTTCNSSGDLHSRVDYASRYMRMAPQVASRLRTAGRKLSASTYPNGGLATASSFVHLTEKEVELLKRWQAEGKSVREVAGLLQRDEMAIRRRMKSAIKVPQISLQATGVRTPAPWNWGPVDRVERPWAAPWTVPWTVANSKVFSRGP